MGSIEEGEEFICEVDVIGIAFADPRSALPQPR